MGEIALARSEVKRRGLGIAPEIAVGDGALGFWKAVAEVYPGPRHQRCWVHKTANVLNKVALSVQANMKKDLREIYLAPNRASAEAAIDVFIEKYGAKYDKAVACLTKDHETLLAFYDFPAEHRNHLRTSNPIESVFATVRHPKSRIALSACSWALDRVSWVWRGSVESAVGSLSAASYRIGHNRTHALQHDHAKRKTAKCAGCVKSRFRAKPIE